MFDHDRTRLNCSFGDLAPGASASVHVVEPDHRRDAVHDVPEHGQATATNNRGAGVGVGHLRCPASRSSKTADADSVSAGDPIGFTVTVTTRVPEPRRPST